MRFNPELCWQACNVSHNRLAHSEQNEAFKALSFRLGARGRRSYSWGKGSSRSYYVGTEEQKESKAKTDVFSYKLAIVIGSTMGGSAALTIFTAVIVACMPQSWFMWDKKK